MDSRCKPLFCIKLIATCDSFVLIRTLQVSLSGVDTGASEGLTLKTLENVMLRHFLGLTREQAIDLYQFYVLKTLRGPKLTMDSHITGKQFYFYWKAGAEMVKSDSFAIFPFHSISFLGEINQEKCELSVRSGKQVTENKEIDKWCEAGIASYHAYSRATTTTTKLYK